MRAVSRCRLMFSNTGSPSCHLSLTHPAMVIPAAADTFHYVSGADGTRIRCRLLLGGPRGDHRLDPRVRTAICLHGIGDDLSFWEEGVFRTAPLSANFAGFGEAATASDASVADESRRWKFARALAQRINVLLVDQRGFGGSDRPRTLAPMMDEALTLLSSWKVTDLKAFTAAARADLRISQSSGAASHCISVSGGTAVLRLSFWTLQFYGAYLSSGGVSEKMEGAELQSLELLGPAERLKELSYFKQPFLEKASKYAKMSTSFHTDVPCTDRVVVLHRVTAVASSTAPWRGAQRFLEEVKDNDSFCISLSWSLEDDAALVTGIFQETDAAVAYLQNFQAWLDGKDADASFQGQLQLAAVQLHARNGKLKGLNGRKNLPKNLEIFQIFPLSFEDSKTTDRSASIQDFVADVEQIRRYCQVDKATICGHSMGAAIALEYAVRFPQRVERLCLCAAAPKVGQAAFDNWMRIAGDGRSWDQQVIRKTVAVVNISDDLIKQLPAPTFLINAKDDNLTPLIGSEMIKANLQISMLYVPEFGGHTCLVRNDAAMERMVQFLFADAAMMFVVDVLLEEQLTSSWNLPKDPHFVRYYNCGRVLAELESLERQLRMTPKQLDFEQLQRQAEEEMWQVVRQRLQMEPSEPSESARELVMAEMRLGRQHESAERPEDLAPKGGEAAAELKMACVRARARGLRIQEGIPERRAAAIASAGLAAVAAALCGAWHLAVALGAITALGWFLEELEGQAQKHLLQVSLVTNPCPHPFADAPPAMVQQCPDGDDVICLNVGGEFYWTLRKTLGQHPSSVLAKMLSGEFPSSWDQNGQRLCIDRDGRLFRHVLNYLRDERLPLGLSRADRTLLLQEAKYYGLDELHESLGGLQEPLPRPAPKAFTGFVPRPQTQELVHEDSPPDLPGSLSLEATRDEGGRPSNDDHNDHSGRPEPTHGWLKRWVYKQEDQEELQSFFGRHGFDDVSTSSMRVPTLLPLWCRLRSPEELFPIHMAAKEGNHRVVRILLQSKVDPEQRSSHGRTALEVAKAAAAWKRRARRDHPDIIHLLENKVQFLSVRELGHRIGSPSEALDFA
eukprot:s430_g5.t5